MGCAVIDLFMESAVWYHLIILSFNKIMLPGKIIYYLLILLEKNTKCFSSLHLLCNKFWFSSGTFNYRWNCIHIDFKCSSMNFHKHRKQPAKYQYLGIAPLRGYKIFRMLTAQTLLSTDPGLETRPSGWKLNKMYD